ncbi:MAG: protein kinase [Chthoniobacterales bacterium]|nr:protein kinase [Chthoniobacterales bacterium]
MTPNESNPKGDHAGIAVSSKTPSICSSCQQPLTNIGSEGECLRCLFGFAFSDDERVNSGVEIGDRSTGRTLHYEHFEVAVDGDGRAIELGAGAMAVTYRAVDTILGCPVALKVIDPRLASHPAARARFLREARAAAKLRHPNIARVSHYGEQDGECYYVMELVDGETLDARVKREGPFSPALALEITERVTQALVAADAGGVVHRDLKPSNLMLVAAGANSPGVKVIDWGLAKAVESGSPLAIDQTFGGFVGTPTYASPEQVLPKKEQRVDARSDIYSLGVTLWYLLCGRTPFVGRTLDEIHQKQVGQALPFEQLTAARVPRPIMALLRSMIAADPGDRPQSARELLARLQRCQAQLASASRHRKLWPRVAAGALLLSLCVFGARIVQRQRAAQAAADRSVAVLPFENLSPDQAVAFFTTGMQDSITDELARIAQLKVVGSESTRSFLPGHRNFAEIGRELGVAHLIEGSVWRDGDRVRVSIQLVNVHTQKRDWSKDYEKSSSDVFAIQPEVTREVATRLRATLSAGESAALNEPPTTDRVAYDLYLRARQGSSWQKGLAEMRRVLQQRLDLFERAVARDRNFVDAYCEIAGIHDELSTQGTDATLEDRAVDHRGLAEAALQKARSLKPDDGKVHLAQANHLLLAVGDTEQARLEADLARRTLPNNGTLEDVTAWIARSDGRWEEALHAAERAVELQPRNSAFLENLVLFNRALRRYEESDRASVRLLAVQEEKERFFHRLFRATGPLEESADLEPLRAAIAAAIPTDATEAAHLYIFRLLLAIDTHDPDAITHELEEDPRPRVNRYGSVYPRGWFEALAARMRGDDSGARAGFTAARAEMERVIEANPAKPRTLSILSMIDAGLRRKEEAMREGARALEILASKKSAATRPVVGCNLAVVYAWTDQPDRAIALLEDLVKQPAGVSLMFQPTYGDLRLNPVWDPLRADPRFKALLESLAPKTTRPLG